MKVIGKILLIEKPEEDVVVRDSGLCIAQQREQYTWCKIKGVGDELTERDIHIGQEALTTTTGTPVDIDGGKYLIKNIYEIVAIR